MNAANGIGDSGNAGRGPAFQGFAWGMFPLFGRVCSAISAALNAGAVMLALGACVALAPLPIVVVDGDTVDRWPWRYRLTGFDAPEVRRPRCAAERAAGLSAQYRLREIIDGAGKIEIVRERRRLDPWGRVLARLVIDGRDVAEIAIAEGWGAAYSGRGPKRDWCNG